MGGEVFLDFVPKPDFPAEGRFTFFSHKNWFERELTPLQDKDEIEAKLREIESESSVPIVVGVMINMETCRKMRKKVYKILRNDSLAEEQNINTMSFSSPRLQYPPEDYIVGFGEKRMLLCRNSKIMSLPIKRD